MPPNQNNASPTQQPTSQTPIQSMNRAPAPDEHGYYRLGHTTLYYMLFKYGFPAILLFLIELVLLGAATGGNALPPFSEWVSQSMTFAEAVRTSAMILPPLILFIIAFAVVMAYAWYYSFKYKIGDNDISFEKGLIARQEISVPFHQIQNVDIEQSVLYRIFDLADLVILTAGHEDPERATENESEIVMPALNAGEARRLHEYLLDKSNVQKVVEVSATTEPAMPAPLD
ncbi:MAG: PH domain-containing protein [Candidatus Pacebacteria bacterium]|nr:PH domain-containing protein [Candidatus Paceibacterota bacterium]